MKKAMLLSILCLGLLFTGCSSQSKLSTNQYNNGILEESNKEITPTKTIESEKSEVLEELQTDLPKETSDSSNSDFTNEDDINIGSLPKKENVSCDDSENNVETVITNNTVDISSFCNEWTEEYGGSLEKDISESLGVELIACSDDYSDYYTICDNRIEFLGSVNGTGFFLKYYDVVPNFTIFGIHPGMSEDEAIKTLNANGLTSDEYGNFAIDPDDYYVFYNVNNGILEEIDYVKCTDAKSAADYE